MAKTLPKIALGAWAWGNDGTFGDNWTADSLRPIFDAAMKAGNIALTADEIAELEKTADSLSLNLIRMWEKKMD